MRHLIEWAFDHHSGLAIAAGLVLLIVCVVLRFGYDLWWNYGFIASIVLMIIGAVRAGGE